MKAIVKDTGESINVEWCGEAATQLGDIEQWWCEAKKRLFKERELVFEEYVKPIDWRYMKIKIAKDAMCSMLSNPSLVDDVANNGEPIWHTPNSIVKVSVILADLLIKELKNNNLK